MDFYCVLFPGTLKWYYKHRCGYLKFFLCLDQVEVQQRSFITMTHGWSSDLFNSAVSPRGKTLQFSWGPELVWMQRNIFRPCLEAMDRDVIATCYGLDGANILRGEIFRIRQTGPLPGCGIDHPPPSSSEVKERVELYVFSPSRPSLHGVTFTCLETNPSS